MGYGGGGGGGMRWQPRRLTVIVSGANTVWGTFRGALGDAVLQAQFETWGGGLSQGACTGWGNWLTN
eukprot:8726844-Pyramimonas_sp.AAC.1